MIYSLYFAFFLSIYLCATTGRLTSHRDEALVFDPFQLDIDITPATIESTLASGNLLKAIIVPPPPPLSPSLSFLPKSPTTCILPHDALCHWPYERDR